MKTRVLITTVITLALVLSELASTFAGAPRPTFSRVSTNNQVIGFGATRAAWNAHHIVDLSGKFNKGSVYDSDPRLKSTVGDGAPDRYVTVSVSQGVVVGYMMNLLKGTSLSAAKASAVVEMPKDAKVSFYYKKDLCATLEMTSATLKPILSRFGDRNGSVDFVFWTNATSLKFNPVNTNEISVGLGTGMDSAKGNPC